jgi:prevent-host-death family protein
MSSTMHEISATEFKATCLKVMDEVHDSHIDVIITKHGKPIAMLVPVPEVTAPELFGCMANMAVIQGDIISPLAGEWEANE